jgi:uncharacterized HAD superfamily protein
MKICFDIDGTICSNTNGEYYNAEPFPERIKRIHSLISEGHEIIFCTARGSETGIDWSDLTRTQLENWGLPSSNLFFGKPSADQYVDDKGVSDTIFFI